MCIIETTTDDALEQFVAELNTELRTRQFEKFKLLL